jgi:hypothetical protein
LEKYATVGEENQNTLFFFIFCFVLGRGYCYSSLLSLNEGKHPLLANCS